MNLVVTGGGTGGHIFAGVAIAQEFLAQSQGNQVLFLGSAEGLETKLVPKAGLPLATLQLGKLVGQSPVQKLLTLVQIPIAIIKSLFILKKNKTDFVVGVGGYAAGPCIVAAKILKIPIAVLEQNSVMGFTNRICASLANSVFLAFEQTQDCVAPAKCIVTGNPVRSQLKPNLNKTQNPFTIFIFGGSQGATGINKLMVAAAQTLKPELSHIKIIHQTGTRDYEWVQKAYQEMQINAEVHPFIDDMQSRYDQASLVICRAGSSTISELAATQNTAIFIPLPTAARNHQEINARAVSQVGAAKVLLQQQATGADLAQMILALKNQGATLQTMRQKMAQFHHPDAAKRMVEVMKVQMYKK